MPTVKIVTPLSMAILKARENENLSIKQWAQKHALSYNLVLGIENGSYRHRLQPNVCKRIAEALGKKPAEVRELYGFRR